MTESERRLEICKKCPIYKEDPFYGPVCNRMKWISENGENSSAIKLPGYKRGCGCRLRWKTLNINNHCIVKKW